jgi:hypothetical protein
MATVVEINRSDTNAILVPSGDQEGSRPLTCVVSSRLSEPSAFMVQTAESVPAIDGPNVVNAAMAILVPFGDQAGSAKSGGFPRSLVGRFVKALPSGFITDTWPLRMKTIFPFAPGKAACAGATSTSETNIDARTAPTGKTRAVAPNKRTLANIGHLPVILSAPPS